MHESVPDFPKLLECLSEKLPALRLALLKHAVDDLALVRLVTGDVLLRKGETAEFLYVVVGGLLRATSLQEDGRELILSEFGPGAVAGEMAILAGGAIYSATVSVAEDAAMSHGPRRFFAR